MTLRFMIIPGIMDSKQRPVVHVLRTALGLPIGEIDSEGFRSAEGAVFTIGEIQQIADRMQRGSTNNDN